MSSAFRRRSSESSRHHRTAAAAAPVGGGRCRPRCDGPSRLGVGSGRISARACGFDFQQLIVRSAQVAPAPSPRHRRPTDSSGALAACGSASIQRGGRRAPEAELLSARSCFWGRHQASDSTERSSWMRSRMSHASRLAAPIPPSAAGECHAADRRRSPPA